MDCFALNHAVDIPRVFPLSRILADGDSQNSVAAELRGRRNRQTRNRRCRRVGPRSASSHLASSLYASGSGGNNSPHHVGLFRRRTLPPCHQVGKSWQGGPGDRMPGPAVSCGELDGAPCHLAKLPIGAQTGDVVGLISFGNSRGSLKYFGRRALPPYPVHEAPRLVLFRHILLWPVVALMHLVVHPPPLPHPAHQAERGDGGSRMVAGSGIGPIDRRVQLAGRLS
jgi:hypothetical protein